MTKPIFTAAIACVLLWSTGCAFFKKTNRPKESSAISSEVEATFHQRWVDKRAAELAAQGTAAAAARLQAEQEFGEHYNFDHKVKK